MTTDTQTIRPRLPKAVGHAIEELGLGGARLLVGVSGGADSVALLRTMSLLGPARQIELFAAHLNHGLRPGAAEADAAFTAELCRRLGVPLVVESANVAEYALGAGLGIEEAARNVRYEFFDRTARSLGCTHVAVAHTADDRIETVLHHLVRGTGLAGLRGMRFSRLLSDTIRLVRPLLRVHRSDIEAWLAEIGQTFRTDESNADAGRTRNRIRHALLPFLQAEFGSRIRGSILRLADQADELQSELEQAAARLLEASIVDETTDVCRVDCRPLAGQARHLVREVFVALWIRKKWPRGGMGFDDWDRLYQLVKDGGTATLPGRIAATRRGTLLVLKRP